MVTFATLCYPYAKGQVLLLRKARGLFGEGKWNAPGGKLHLGETPDSAAFRETLEETGLSVSNLRFHGCLHFYLGEARQLDQIVFVFSSNEYAGNLRPSREGELRWFSIKEIPYSEMWEDDRTWLPLLFEGKSFIGGFYFTDNYGQLVNGYVNSSYDQADMNGKNESR